jgi:hypothetical protein
MKRFITTVRAFILALSAFLIAGATPTFAQGATQSGAQAAQGTGVPSTLFGNGGIITNITNVLLFVVGALAVIMIIWGGIRYATSGGNASNVTAAKNTILYAIVGLIIAFLAFAIVNWVLSAITPGGGSGFSNS